MGEKITPRQEITPQKITPRGYITPRCLRERIHQTLESYPLLKANLEATLSSGGALGHPRYYVDGKSAVLQSPWFRMTVVIEPLRLQETTRTASDADDQIRARLRGLRQTTSIYAV